MTALSLDMVNSQQCPELNMESVLHLCFFVSDEIAFGAVSV